MDDELEEFLTDFYPPKPEPPPRPPLPSDFTDDALDTYLGEPDPVVVECAVPTREINAEDLVVFNPLEQLGEKALERKIILTITKELLMRGPFPLVGLEQCPFDGNGVYAYYYHGDLLMYGPINSPGSTCPIYTGKSAQPGRHKGNTKPSKNNLYRRLGLHCKSLQQAQFGLEDFTFRFLLLPDIWVDFAEHGLIEMFQPLWNIISGFGSRSMYARGSETFTTSAWDTLHPGRKGAGTRIGTGTRSVEEVEQSVREELPACVRAYQNTMIDVENLAHP